MCSTLLLGYILFGDDKTTIRTGEMPGYCPFIDDDFQLGEDDDGEEEIILIQPLDAICGKRQTL